MKITVSVALDDGTQITRVVDVNSADNPRFWSNGVRKGADWAVRKITAMLESEHGVAAYEGIHIINSG